MSRELTRRGFLATGTAALAWACSRRDEPPPFDPSSPLPPNLLLIVSDDQALDDVGCYGSTAVATPSIDRIAADGIRFTCAFTPTAICQPSRGAIHTGLHGTTSGADGEAPIRAGIVPLSATLRRAGYRTALIGKTHLEPIEQFEFDFLKESRELSGGFDVEAIVRHARDFVRGCVADRRPYFLNVNFNDPHTPWPLFPAEAEARLPEFRKRPKDGDPRDRTLGGVAGLHDPARVRLPTLLPDIPEIRAELARYGDAITRLDRGVGLLLDALDDAGLAATTAVLFLSDNGMDFPFHKTTLWEGGVRQPLLVRWPGVTPRGATCDGLVSFVDLMPTFLEIAGVPALGPLEGRSIRAALADPATPLREEVLLTHTRQHRNAPLPSRGVRTHRHKYLRNFWPAGTEFRTMGMQRPSWEAFVAAARDDAALAERLDRFLHRPAVELYDLEADPIERTNLAGRTEVREVEDELRVRLKDAMTRIADPLVERV